MERKKTKLKRRLVVFSILVTGSLLLFAAAMEIYLRKTRPQVVKRVKIGAADFVQRDTHEIFSRLTPKGHRLIPNTRVTILRNHLSKKDVKIDINSLGMREEEIGPKEPGEFRILVLGDSITLGDYLQTDQVYVKRIQHYLNKQEPERKIRVFNAGVGDIGIREQVGILTDTGLATRPDVVLVSFYLNDSRPPWGFSGELGHRGWLRRHSVLAETIYKNKKFKEWAEKDGMFRFMWIQAQNELDWMHNRTQFKQLIDLAKYDWGAAWNSESWDMVEQHLAAIAALSSEHGFKVALACFPVKFQVHSDFALNSPQGVLSDIARWMNVPYFDLLPVLRKHRDTTLFYDHCHPNEAANDIIGRALAKGLHDSFLKE